jgi:hypothetical protein
LINSHY